MIASRMVTDWSVALGRLGRVYNGFTGTRCYTYSPRSVQHLKLAFARTGIDVVACKHLVADADLQQLPIIPRAVQEGLRFGL